MNNYDKFDIVNFVNEVKGKDFLDLFDYCQEHYKWLESIKFTKNCPFEDIEWLVREYRNFIHAFCYTLHTRNKPCTVKKEDFQKVKPIIKSLVAKGQWRKEDLDIFK